MRIAARVLVIVLAMALVAARLVIASQPVRGRTFLVKDPKPGVNPAKRSVVVVAVEPASDDALLGDPIAHGAYITIIANGAVSTVQTFFVPPGAAPPYSGPGWKTVGSPPFGYSYKDKAGVNGPVKAALIENKRGTFVMEAVLVGVLGPGLQPHISVVPPNLGTEGGMHFFIPLGGDDYCTGFGGAAGGTITDDSAKAFKVKGPTSQTCTVSSATTTITGTVTSTYTTSTTSTEP